MSKHKRRYTEDGFDLDLSYIDCLPHLKGTLVALSSPTEGKEGLLPETCKICPLNALRRKRASHLMHLLHAAWYRNDARDVRRFLEAQVRPQNLCTLALLRLNEKLSVTQPLKFLLTP